MVGVIITLGGSAILGLIFLGWMSTPKGKRWLSSL